MHWCALWSAEKKNEAKENELMGVETICLKVYALNI